MSNLVYLICSLVAIVAFVFLLSAKITKVNCCNYNTTVSMIILLLCVIILASTFDIFVNEEMYNDPRAKEELDTRKNISFIITIIMTVILAIILVFNTTEFGRKIFGLESWQACNDIAKST